MRGKVSFAIAAAAAEFPRALSIWRMEGILKILNGDPSGWKTVAMVRCLVRYEG